MLGDREKSRTELLEELAELRRRLAETESFYAGFDSIERVVAGAELLQSVMEIFPFPLLITRLSDGKILYANEELGRLLGRPVQDLVGQKAPDFYANPAERAHILAEVERAGAIRGHEMEGKKVDGTPFWGRGAAKKVRYEETDALLTGFQDFTTRKQEEAALRDSETRFRTVVETLDEGLLITDLDDRVIYMNGQVTELTGYSASELVGKPAYQFLLPPDRWESLLGRNQERSQGFSERYEMELQCKDGRTFWAEIHGIPYRGPSGEVVGTLGVIADVSGRKRTEEELIRLERLRALGEMAQGVAHNFNNLLVGVLGHAQLIQVKTRDPHIAEDLAEIVDSALRAKELVHRLTRSVEGDRGSIPTAVWVREAVEEAVEVTRPR